MKLLTLRVVSHINHIGSFCRRSERLVSASVVQYSGKSRRHGK